MIDVVAAGVIDGKMVTDDSCIVPASASRLQRGQPAGLDGGADDARRGGVDDDEQDLHVWVSRGRRRGR